MILSAGFLPLLAAPGWRFWGDVHILNNMEPLDRNLITTISETSQNKICYSFMFSKPMQKSCKISTAMTYFVVNNDKGTHGSIRALWVLRNKICDSEDVRGSEPLCCRLIITVISTQCFGFELHSVLTKHDVTSSVSEYIWQCFGTMRYSSGQGDTVETLGFVFTFITHSVKGTCIQQTWENLLRLTAWNRTGAWTPFPTSLVLSVACWNLASC